MGYKLHGINKKTFIVFCILILISFSCEKNVRSNNPFDTNIPTTPCRRFLQINAMAENFLTISWKGDFEFNSPEQSNASYIILEESIDGKIFSVMDSIKTKDTGQKIKAHFLTNQQYYFRVRARIGSRHTSYSNMVSNKIEFLAPGSLKIKFNEHKYS